MTHKGWPVIKPQHNEYILLYSGIENQSAEE